MSITWDDAKARQNLEKHKVSFERAQRVFNDPHLVSVPDPYEYEERWRTYGLVDDVVILMVVHTVSELHGEEQIRIISARKATRDEREKYEKSSKGQG